MRLTLRVHAVVCRVNENAGADSGRVIPSLAMNQDAGLDASELPAGPAAQKHISGSIPIRQKYALRSHNPAAPCALSSAGLGVISNVAMNGERSDALPTAALLALILVRSSV
eukprot:207490-Rhodomonas_salina.1